MPRLLAPTLLLLAAASPAHGDTAFRQDFRQVEVADGIIAFVATESPGGVVQGNVTVVSGKDASLVVDSGQYPSLADRMVEAIRAAGLPPVRWLLNTHWHGDHLMANGVFEAAWPGLQVLQHAETARVAPLYYTDWQTTGIQRTRDAAEGIRKALETGKSQSGKPLTDDQRSGAEIDAALIAQWMPEAPRTDWQPADVTFEGTLVIDLGGREVELRHPGLANTTGDTVLWDPATKTLVTGDIVVHPTPYSFGSYHSEWIDTLQALRDLQPAAIVPGHGEVMRDDAYLARLQVLLTETRRQVRDAIAAAGDAPTLEGVRESVDLASFEREFAGGDANRVRAFRAFYLQPGVEQAWKEARGEARSK